MSRQAFEGLIGASVVPIEGPPMHVELAPALATDRALTVTLVRDDVRVVVAVIDSTERVVEVRRWRQATGIAQLAYAELVARLRSLATGHRFSVRVHDGAEAAPARASRPALIASELVALGSVAMLLLHLF